jgi:adenylyltransferase/sulfurtransferase
MAHILIPTPLRKFTGGAGKIDIVGETLLDAVKDLAIQFPDLEPHLFDKEGELQKFLRIYIGEEDIQALNGTSSSISQSDEICIVPAIAGGKDELLFTKAELERYSRHLIIPEFNLEGQTKLKRAKVLIVGTGGLGAPLLQYLSAAGIGTIGILDFDVVEDHNLQRQVLFTTEDVGKSKVEAAAARIKAQNPYIKINIHQTRLSSENALEIIKDYDVVADGTDNFPTRYLVNDACVILGKPNVYASIFRFEGQLSVFNHKRDDGSRGPNYRDLFPTPPPPGLVPSCAEGGVIGVLPGILGSLQANEVIKVISGVGDVLDGRIFLFDASTFQTRTLKLYENKDNPLRGENPQKELIDYEEFCGLKTPIEKIEAEKSVNVIELNDWLKTEDAPVIIDVREPYEYEIANLGAQLIPQGDIENHVHEIPFEKPVVVHCRSGVRSAKVINLLESKYGFRNLYNLEGGILAWADQIDSEMATY